MAGALDAAGPGPETTRHDQADFDLVRRTAAQGMVLLRNSVPDGGDTTVLPLVPRLFHRILLANGVVLGPDTLETALPGAFGIDREQRDELFELRTLARRTRRSGRVL